ncbi:helix-turn-helix domain-containing protein [Pseudohongiella sp.]|uniref:helix-turn-helix domain-containing protein n=1 Tax=Pseudohongiella sp. TaxID=1979412 RepID=UPI0034A05346
MLAREAAQSRTSFASTFKTLSDWAVMEYVRWWRMQLAWKYLQEGTRLAEIPLLVGYQSPAAFSRAFKQCFGVNPSKMHHL